MAAELDTDPPLHERATRTATPAAYSLDRHVVLRTPLLPLGDFVEWSAAPGSEPDPGAAAPAIERAVARLRADLAARLADPVVREALLLASPGLVRDIDVWRRDPDSRRGQSVERALVRYFSRMATRPTPFGLLAGVSAGELGAGEPSPEPVRFVLSPRAAYRRHTRLDNDYLFALTAALERDPAIRAGLRYAINSSAFEAAGQLRYVEIATRGDQRTYQVVAAELTEAIAATLDRLGQGARPAEIAAALTAAYPGIEPADAGAFVAELIASQIIVCELSPPVTGDEPIRGVRRALEAAANSAPGATRAAVAGSALADVEARLAALDGGGLGAGPAAYDAIAGVLEELATTAAAPAEPTSDPGGTIDRAAGPPRSIDRAAGPPRSIDRAAGPPRSIDRNPGPPRSIDRSRLFQVDLVKPASLALGPAVRREIVRGVELLARIGESAGSSALDEFRASFAARYGEARVPLCEALDEDIGVGYDVGHGPGASPSPLFAGLRFPPRGEAAPDGFTARHAHLLRRLHDAAGQRELVLDDDDLAALTAASPPRLPDALGGLVVVARAGDDVRLLVEWLGGPPGVRVLGRFCHVPAIERAVRAHLAAEEALRPDAVFAEVVHLPAGRIGNILCRPVLRGAEIPYMGVSGAPADRRLAVRDLDVAVTDGRVTLHARDTGQEVIPRLTSAHAHQQSLGMYRFLCALQEQDGAGVGWHWGPLSAAPFLPRLRHGRVVLARARWRLVRRDLEPLARAARTGADGSTARGREAEHLAVQALRRTRGLPGQVILADADNELYVDLDNPLSTASFVHLVKGRAGATLVEPFCGPDELCASGPEGDFVHELHVSLVRRNAGRAAGTGARARPTGGATRPSEPAVRRFAPGSEWLYARLYCGSRVADRVLLEAVAPVVRRVRDRCRGWFFIRYDQPAWHLRVRFAGEPAILAAEVEPELLAAAGELERRGLVWQVELATYDREVERYGGPAGIAICEQMFFADSDAVVAILAAIDDDDARWRTALLGVDRLLDDLGLDLAGKLAWADAAREMFGREFAVDTAFRKQLGVRFRGERNALMELLRRPHPDVVRNALEARKARLGPLARTLAARARAGELTASLAEVADSLVHMHVNRMIASEQRAHELVIYEFLARVYRARRAAG